MELKKLLSLLGNERGCGPFERSGEKAPIDEGSSDARSMRRISRARVAWETGVPGIIAPGYQGPARGMARGQGRVPGPRDDE